MLSIHPPRGLRAATVLLALSPALPLFADTYGNTVIADSPLAFYRLGGALEPDLAINRISPSPIGNGTHLNVTHGAPGVTAWHANAATSYAGPGGANASRTSIPYNAALNPDPSGSFTIEGWLRPTLEGSLTAGQAPLFNRNSSANPRQGWVFFQRGSVDDTTNPDGKGFNFRMYGQSGSNPSINLYGGSYTINSWVHVAATWNGATRTATLYVDGQKIMDQVVPANTVAFLPNASIPLTLGSYDTGDNPFTGDIDEVAYYPTALTASQISAHALNAPDPNALVPYPDLVKTDGATLYLREDEKAPSRVAATNLGSLGSDAEPAHYPGAVHHVPGALTSGTDTALGYRLIYPTNSEGCYPTVLPYQDELNSSTFSVELWVKPLAEGNNNAQCPFFNYLSSGDRSGWVLWQRASNVNTSPTSDGYGWNFRMYKGVGSDRAIDLKTASNMTGSYTIGQWQHLVVTFDNATKTAVFYVNGQAAGTQTISSGDYLPNSLGSGIVPSIGGFPNTFENGFNGDIDEVALYSHVLSASEVQSHYDNAKNASPAVSYDSLVLSHSPVAYYRMDEAAKGVVTNLGSLGTAAQGTQVNTIAPVDGPALAGFDAGNKASDFDGSKTFVELNNATGMDIVGPITLEAWVKPSANQNFTNSIISHGGNENFAGELYLRIENGNYEVGGKTGKASVAIPDGDLGSADWIHLTGTWSAGTWTLYRNGVSIGTGADATGPATVVNANWAIGARGRWHSSTNYADAPERIFNGGIASAAIYNTALSATAVNNHYLAGVGATPLTISRPGGVVTLTWSGGILQESADLVTWTDVVNATSPYLPPTTDVKHFYRLRN